MKTDERVIEAIFKGDSVAFSRFVNDNREKFFSFFKKKYPTSKISIDDVFQEACIALWTQIVDGKMTRDKLQVDLSTYLVSIGRNKFLEETRSGIRIAKLKVELPFRRKRTTEEQIKDDGKHPLQSEKAQKELDKNINDKDKNDPLAQQRKLEEQAQKEMDPVIILETTDSWVPADKEEEWRAYILDLVEKMKEPCRSILLLTWWNKFSDEQIVKISKGKYTTTGAVKTQRFRCHKKLQTVLKPRYDALKS